SVIDDNCSECVILASDDAIIETNQGNKVLIGRNVYARPSNGPALYIGQGIVAPDAVNNGLGIAAYIQTPGTPSIGIVTANQFVSPFADYGEYFEWEDGNINNEDRRGLFVTF